MQHLAAPPSTSRQGEAPKSAGQMGLSMHVIPLILSLGQRMLCEWWGQICGFFGKYQPWVVTNNDSNIGRLFLDTGAGTSSICFG